jgi:hypothetical protein
LTTFIASEFPGAATLIIGDLNAYAKEDPITALEGAGYTNLVSTFGGAEAYSYSFSGFLGSLDHALANESALTKTVDVTEWHINADEPIALDYNTSFKSEAQIINFYAADAYRSSDHDPVLVSLQLDAVSETLYSGQLQVLPDMNGDEVAELGVLSVDVEASRVRLEVLDGKTQDLLSTLVWRDNFSDESISLHVLDDMNENGMSEVGLFGVRDTQANENKPQMLIRDLSTGNVVSVLNWPANWSNVSALVLPDITGDGIQEVAIQGSFKNGNRPQLVVRDGLTNASVDTFGYPNLFITPEYYVHSDVNGDGVSEVSTFGRIAGKSRIQVKIASGVDSKDRLKAYNFPDKWSDISWYRLDDMNGDGQDDWGLLGRNREDGRVQLIVKDGVAPKGALAIYGWAQAIQTPTFYRISDMNADGVDEVAVAGQNSNDDSYQFQIKDGQDRNVMLAIHGLNLNLTGVSYHVLPDLSGDGIVEIGFLGLNPSGEYELVIRHGDVTQGEYRTDNLGNDWSSAPSITSLGDTDNDGIDNLLIYGQNDNEQLIMLPF